MLALAPTGSQLTEEWRRDPGGVQTDDFVGPAYCRRRTNHPPSRARFIGDRITLTTDLMMDDD